MWSSLHEFSHEWRSGLPAATVRYVISGYEAYNLNSETVRVGPGKFLVVNKAQGHSAHIPYTSEPVTGFCVALNNALLNDVYHNHLEDDDSLLDNPFTNTGKEFHFCEKTIRPLAHCNQELNFNSIGPFSKSACSCISRRIFSCDYLFFVVFVEASFQI